LRIAEFILRNEGPEARGKGLLAFSLKSAAGGRSSNLYQGKILIHEPIIPVFHYSNTPDETFHHSNSPEDFAHGQGFSLETEDSVAGNYVDGEGHR
jgi:hypothetical protein